MIRYRLAAVLVLTVSPLLNARLLSQEVVIELKDGRSIRGSVDRNRSDTERLWIQQVADVLADDLSVSSGFPWENIAQIRLDQAGSTAQLEPRRYRTTYRPANVGEGFTTAVWGGGPVPRSRTSHAPTQVRAVAFESALANWDRDSAIDGMLLTLYPLDEQRRFVPARGIVYATLHTWERDGSQTRLVPSERWSEHVQARNIFSDGIEIQLPFRQLRDARERFLRDSGLLVVRYSVPGLGSFRAEGVVPLSLD